MSFVRERDEWEERLERGEVGPADNGRWFVGPWKTLHDPRAGVKDREEGDTGQRRRGVRHGRKVTKRQEVQSGKN